MPPSPMETRANAANKTAYWILDGVAQTLEPVSQSGGLKPSSVTVSTKRIRPRKDMREEIQMTVKQPRNESARMAAKTGKSWSSHRQH